ncbi:armadillo-type protein [Aspergillus californicus]
MLDRDGTPIAGARLIRIYPLNPCQEEFERIWDTPPPSKHETTESGPMTPQEIYDQRGIGLVAFIGELYKVGMLVHRIIHDCVKAILTNKNITAEAQIESLTTLLRITGAKLDAGGAKEVALVDDCLSLFRTMMEDPDLSQKSKPMLQLMISLRQSIPLEALEW